MRLPSVFVSHGAGPLPLLGEASNAALAAALRALPASLPARPAAVLVCSAHFEAARPTLIAAPPAALLYDYGGFPKEAYSIQYSPPGAPAVAERAMALLSGAGFRPALERSGRGLDHGAFVPLALMWPGADVPVVELSVLASLDAEEHLRMGAALGPLRDEGVLLLGSGSSFHDIPQIFRGMHAPPGAPAIGKEFDGWLVDACTRRAGAARAAELAGWAAAPGGAAAHPRPEHFMPLLFAAGAGGGEPGRGVAAPMGAVAMTSFVFGG
ncbi:MAG: Extradiol aromatic ring-opening dioxygenase [Monoraphidium minutum]|nr:MAG: Extradiol aromatic ring-opening dioxygenase [Monoraphidium minutum]